MYNLVAIPEFAADKSFFSFTKKEAQTYLEWFLAIIPRRIAYLESQVAIDLGSWQADYSRDSLAALDEWFLSKASFRKKDSAETAVFEAQMAKSPLLGNVISRSLYTLSDETVSKCFDVGVYLAEAIRQANPKYEWRYLLKPKRYVNYAQPILLGDQDVDTLNPRVLERKLIHSFLNEPELYSDIFKIYDWTVLGK